MKSEAEMVLALQLTKAGLTFLPQHRISMSRRWRADFFLPPHLVVEIEGGTWINGRHTRGRGFENDCEKQAAALMQGHKVLRVTTRQVMENYAIAWITHIMNLRSET